MSAPISTTSDVELTAIGAEAGPKLDEVRSASDRFWAADPTRIHEIDTLVHHDRLWELYNRAITLGAETLDGVRAKLLLVRWQLEIEHRLNGRLDLDDMSPAERMAWSLCTDLLGSPGADVVSPDAELIAACEQFTTADTSHDRLLDDPASPEDDTVCAEFVAPFIAAQDQAIDRMRDLRATSTDGILARARAIAAHTGDFGNSFDYPHDTYAGRMLSYLLRDAAALSGDVVPVPSEKGSS